MERQLATLKLPSCPEKSLTRAISFSELPTSRRILIQQAESSGGLVKQYSCEQIYDKVSNTRQVNVLTTITSPLSQKDNVWSPPSHTALPRDNSPGWHRRIHSFTTEADLAIKPAPMLSLNGLRISEPSPPKMPESPPKRRKTTPNPEMPPPEVSNFQDFKKPKKTPPKSAVPLDTNDLKKQIRSLVPPDLSTPPERRTSFPKLSFFALISLAIVLISTMVIDFTQKPFDFKNASLELRQNVFGQDEAVEALISHFQMNSDNFTVILMTGGTGVGKTYTANIIKKHFPHKYNIFEFFPPIEGHPTIYTSLSHLHCNLLIVDNLKIENAKDFVNLTKFLQEQKVRPCVILIGILNPQVVDEYLVKTVNLERTVEYLEDLIDREGVRGKVIAFKPLNSETIERCITREARESDVELSDKDYQEVKALLSAANSGCKGAHAKVIMFKEIRQKEGRKQWNV